MPQIFQSYCNKLVRFGLITLTVILFLTAITAYAYFQSSYYNEVGMFHVQPIPFSHKQHVQALGLDCRFCHSAVEKSSTAGMPSTEVCMSCHSQILNNAPTLAAVRNSFLENHPLQWNRVYILADHVFFNHSIHINKGISCKTCHGNVQEMSSVSKSKPLNMKWCLSCHAHPENYLITRNIDRTRLTNCYECHR